MLWKKKAGRLLGLDVDTEGLISLEQLKTSIRPDTVVVSVMFANNEIGGFNRLLRLERSSSNIAKTTRIQSCFSL